ncbi:class I SAM-dependent methyltransferase [Thalassomonas viridans]|uniref:Class I SAM-dependent methyltransferase n=1 Tax=Thalassomonas viridans TaxID=137584 RepID=A0AAE9Z5F5_9GAMM|nr:class I SAM-dependent methyltransferase [Thalassomonas viridans]WDE07086.1 class I SAM-dependent methyltransferase [Thalassomonas viridans]
MSSLQDFIKWNEAKWESKNQQMYQGKSDNRWPWFSEELDPDIGDFLQVHNIHSAKMLDLGTCSGSQAIALAKMGYQVVGSDISGTALAKAKNKAQNLPWQSQVEFVLDDILDSRLAPGQFDFILDRGCFHSVCCISTKKYIANLLKLLKPDGKVLLKTMSLQETRFSDYDVFAGQKIPMPYRFDDEILHNVFSESFHIEKITDSYFYSSVIKPPARAKLAVLSKKA